MKMVNGKMTTEFFYDSVGRRRKLSDNTMQDIRRQFREGATVNYLALTYGVSKQLIYTITYDTPRQADLDEMRARQEHVRRKLVELDRLKNPGA